MRTLALLLCVAAAHATVVNYEGYKVVRVTPEDISDATWVHKLVKHLDLPVWKEAKQVGHSTDIMVAPHQASSFLDRLKRKSIKHHIMIDDVQKIINEQKADQRTDAKRFDHTAYHDLDSMYNILETAASENSDLMTVSDLGSPTYENNQQKIVKISSGGDDTRPVVWIDCGIHAREWVSPAVCQYIMDQLTSLYGKDTRTTSLLDSHDFIFVPSVNPDGYRYTWNGDRIWRKNRVPYGFCYGTDCNRNFDSDFGGPGTSDSSCSDIYHGPSAFSEIETQNLRDEVNNLADRMKVFLTLHSYSQLWMTPYGYTHSLPANYDDQYAVAEAGVAALEAVHGTQFDFGNIADTIYLAAGGSSDWAYDTAGVQYAFALELRDTGYYGFLLPADQIIPCGEETWAGIMAAVEAI
ncbi:unnamed protein product [Meganyctiphanes norvegica]|uniref:Zinc carboxypeptidase A 1 n=1 Tax=Meganyctiphanes norvegica TaxID=48144 RepID=A0AAV2PRV6_MEGNR